MAAHRGQSNKRDQAIPALLSQPTIALAAKAAGISETTIHRWLKEADFQAQYREARHALVEHAIVSLQQGLETAATVLRSVVVDRDVPVQTRVAAARTILEYGLKGTDLEHLEARIAALEAQLGASAHAAA